MAKNYRIISARLEFDTQHIAFVGNDRPICGSKIMQAYEIPLKRGYLCERCARKYKDRRCPACGALLEESSVYCDTCGTDTPRC